MPIWRRRVWCTAVMVMVMVTAMVMVMVMEMEMEMEMVMAVVMVMVMVTVVRRVFSAGLSLDTRIRSVVGQWTGLGPRS